jgi:hypothetical protein
MNSAKSLAGKSLRAMMTAGEFAVKPIGSKSRDGSYFRLGVSTGVEVAEITCFVPRWIEELLARYNAFGPNALGDLRRNNGASPSVLRPELLAKLKLRLLDPPPDGGIWTSGKVACWMAAELGVVEVAAHAEVLQAAF